MAIAAHIPRGRYIHADPDVGFCNGYGVGNFDTHPHRSRELYRASAFAIGVKTAD